MKHYSKLKVYKGSNLVIKDDYSVGYSYKWYEILKTVKGVVVLNTYHYSKTTIKHIYKIRNLMYEKNVEYEALEFPQGLQNKSAALDHYGRKIKEIQSKIDNPRTRKVDFYKEELKMYQKKVDLTNALF